MPDKILRRLPFEGSAAPTKSFPAWNRYSWRRATSNLAFHGSPHVPGISPGVSETFPASSSAALSTGLGFSANARNSTVVAPSIHAVAETSLTWTNGNRSPTVPLLLFVKGLHSNDRVVQHILQARPNQRRRNKNALNESEPFPVST